MRVLTLLTSFLSFIHNRTWTLWVGLSIAAIVAAVVGFGGEVYYLFADRPSAGPWESIPWDLGLTPGNTCPLWGLVAFWGWVGTSVAMALVGTTSGWLLRRSAKALLRAIDAFEAETARSEAETAQVDAEIQEIEAEIQVVQAERSRIEAETAQVEAVLALLGAKTVTLPLPGQPGYDDDEVW